MIALVALAAAAALPQPVPDVLRTFGDWVAGCDNGRACRAVAQIAPRDGEGYFKLSVTRAAEPAARARLSWSSGPREGVLSVDGRPVARVSGGSAVVDRAMAALLARGRDATIDGTTESAYASLAGLGDAMRYMDERQDRLGTTAALIATGTRVANAVPPRLPVIVAPPAASTPPPAIADARVRALLTRYDTSCVDPGAPGERSLHRLDARHTVLLVRLPCEGGAYNAAIGAWVIGEGGRVVAAPMPPGSRTLDAANGWLFNARWDRSTRRLLTRRKMRGQNDCGVGQDFAWDGHRFALVREEAMDECRGATDFITTWRVRVVQR